MTTPAARSMYRRVNSLLRHEWQLYQSDILFLVCFLGFMFLLLQWLKKEYIYYTTFLTITIVPLILWISITIIIEYFCNSSIANAKVFETVIIALMMISLLIYCSRDYSHN